MYILFTGAPGSKWSSVAESLCRSPDIDTTDSTSGRTYNNGEVKHRGSYFDPGMEYDNDRENWDRPFSGQGKRVIKSHTFAHDLPRLSTLGYPIVMVYRSHLECYDWWVQAGGFDITYPNYQYYENLEKMKIHIQNQNKDINRFILANLKRISCPVDNFDLYYTLGLNPPPRTDQIHNYADRDTKVYVYR